MDISQGEASEVCDDCARCRDEVCLCEDRAYHDEWYGGRTMKVVSCKCGRVWECEELTGEVRAAVLEHVAREHPSDYPGGARVAKEKLAAWDAVKN